MLPSYVERLFVPFWLPGWRATCMHAFFMLDDLDTYVQSRNIDLFTWS